MTSGEPHPFQWRDIQLYMSKLQLDVFEAKAPKLHAADWSGMTFTVQKSGVATKLNGKVDSVSNIFMGLGGSKGKKINCR